MSYDQHKAYNLLFLHTITGSLAKLQAFQIAFSAYLISGYLKNINDQWLRCCKVVFPIPNYDLQNFTTVKLAENYENCLV